MNEELVETNRSLWVLTVSPGIWAAHLLLSYTAGAIWCAKLTAAPSATLGPVRAGIAVLTGLSLAGIAFVGWRGWQRHSFGHAEVPHDDDTPEDRHRFLGLATLLLSGLSAVAVLYQALAAVFIRSCA